MTQEALLGETALRDGRGLVACPVCDVLYKEANVAPGMQAKCRRCGTVLFAPRQSAMTKIVMLAATAAILMIAAVFFPFLELDAGGLNRRSSVFDAILAFSDGWMAPLSVAVAATVVLLPFARLCAIAYALGPMAIGWHPAKYAGTAMRWAEAVRPWAMAEIFILGVAVALVKVAGLAKVTLGPAFWAFAALVLLTVLKDSVICKLSVWKTLEERRNS